MIKALEALKELRENVCFFAISDYAYPRFDIIEKELKALEIIKELILVDLVFDDEKQLMSFTFGLYIYYIKIEDKDKYDLLKEVLL